MSYPYNVLAPMIGTAAAITAITPATMSIATTIGTFFAPNTAATAGGAVKIIAATSAGSLLTFVPATLGLIVAGLLLVTGLNINSSKLIHAAIFMGILDVVGTYFLAAKIGASITGVTTSAVLFCNMIGAAVVLLGLALAVGGLLAGAAAIFSTFAEGVAPGSLSSGGGRRPGNW